MSGRLEAISVATRPAMFGRILLSGPSGGGKTWTALSLAKVLSDDNLSKVLVIDTEAQSALTYADNYPGFDHLGWEAPYDPLELAQTLEGIQPGKYSVIIVDSFTHFWKGVGGTLDQADGKFGGWREARPAQARVLDALLRVPAHTIICARSAMEYQVSADGKKVDRIGLAPQQDQTLIYEVNVGLEIDMDHNIHVVKSRSTAVPVGRMYPAGFEKKCATEYAAWLAGGEPLIDNDEIEAIKSAFSAISDEKSRTKIKKEFVKLFGMPESIQKSKIGQALEWIEAQIEQQLVIPEPVVEVESPPAEVTVEEVEPVDEATVVEKVKTAFAKVEESVEPAPKSPDSEVARLQAQIDSISKKKTTKK